MSNNIKLSIYIPTYNRLDYLKSQVMFLIDEIKPYQDVELIISNNNSTDGTADYLLELEKVYSKNNIEISSNLENIGVKKNIEKCIEVSQGEFIWIVGDDDKLKKGIVKAIMDVISMSDNNLTWIVLNFEKNGKGLPKGSAHRNYDTNLGFELFKQVVKTDSLTPMFITANVIKRKCALNALNVVGSGNYAIPMGFALCASLNGNGKFIKESFIVANNDNISWKKESIFIYCNDIPMVILKYKKSMEEQDYKYLVKTILDLDTAIKSFFLNLIKGNIDINLVIRENMELRPIYTLLKMIYTPIIKFLSLIRRKL